MTRTYELKRRAERQEETRRRIVAAVWELHRTVGPAQTTISAIAERAGVQRLTVYRHFPDELSLFQACARHDLDVNPPPDPEAWASIADPAARLRLALTDLYNYYERGEEILANIRRDTETLPALAQVAREAQRGLTERAPVVLAAGWEHDGSGGALRTAAVGHALDFETWCSLVRGQGLTSDQAVDLMAALVRCAAGINAR